MLSSVRASSASSIDISTKQPTEDRTYVMKGSYADKSLDIYHLILAPSFACNNLCRHCYLTDHSYLTMPKERVISLIDEWSDIVLAERGLNKGIFHLKGGEPLMLPYFNDVLDHLARLRTLQFMMTTNGTLGSGSIADRLATLNESLEGNAKIIVSLDGSNDSINAQLRGPGNFAKTVEFIKQLTQRGITVYLNNVLHKGNLDDIPSFIALALELGAVQVNFLNLIPKGNGESMDDCCPDPAEVFNRIDIVWQRGDERIKKLLAGSLSDILHAESCGTCTSPECVGGYRGLLYIVPDGTAYPCPNLNSHELKLGTVLRDLLKTILNAIHNISTLKLITPRNKSLVCYSCKGLKYIKASCRNNYFRLSELHIMYRKSLSNSIDSYCFNRNF